MSDTQNTAEVAVETAQATDTSNIQQGTKHVIAADFKSFELFHTTNDVVQGGAFATLLIDTDVIAGDEPDLTPEYLANVVALATNIGALINNQDVVMVSSVLNVMNQIVRSGIIQTIEQRCEADPEFATRWQASIEQSQAAAQAAMMAQFEQMMGTMGGDLSIIEGEPIEEAEAIKPAEEPSELNIDIAVNSDTPSAA